MNPSPAPQIRDDSQAGPAPVLRVSNVSKSYAGRPVLRGVSFRLDPGQRLALTGPSGSGKTTLLNCLGGVDRPDSGSICLHGLALEEQSN